MKRILKLIIPSILMALVFFPAFNSCGFRNSSDKSETGDSISVNPHNESEGIPAVFAVLVSPKNPLPGQPFRLMLTGGKNILKAKIQIAGVSGNINSTKSRSGDGLPFWRVEEYLAGAEGEYRVEIHVDDVPQSIDFNVGKLEVSKQSQSVWKTERGWDGKMEALYAAWVNALFYEADERSSWKALHEVTQQQGMNFLHNHFSIGEDGASAKIKVIMEPDCADNPYYLRAYFAWKLGLPFGYHESDRGMLGRAPKTGRWITNEIVLSSGNPIHKFNSFMRMVMNGVHSGTARAALDNENTDYYPLPLTAQALRPGVVYADPYGHTFVLIRRLPQTKDRVGVQLAVDAQPDGTVGVKRFWKGNFLFNTVNVIGEPGFKAFRPIVYVNGQLRLLKTHEITENEGFLPFSIQQKGMEMNEFYSQMEHVINPQPLDPEMAFMNLIKALHEQLVVRVTSVANGEEYMKAHPGTVIPMPGRAAGVFQTGGVWEDYSTPNRDLRLLIAMDAVLDFPQKVYNSPDDYKLPLLKSIDQVKKDLEDLLTEQSEKLTISYIRSNGSEQVLTIAEILKRREAFEMAYNPNDCPEIRWGAPENSDERSTCKRKVFAGQLKTMQTVREWFHKRLHPPT